ncbi:hypothetical protein FQN55_000046 [Onygenales sp. PD_40]|nr:hypothetical protein FQN55_000046 [Onygenales sp. PD_40]
MSANRAFIPQYDPRCPYYRNMAPDGSYHIGRMFRLIEPMDNGQLFVGDSFGSGHYIDPDAHRPCTPSCACWFYGNQPEQAFFTFSAIKSKTTMELRIYSGILRDEIIRLLEAVSLEPLYDSAGSFDGLVLLKHYHLLNARLEELYNEHDSRRKDTNADCLLEEMTLLVEGLLNDFEVFNSFRYENLVAKGYLTFQDWKDFQNAKVNCDLDSLENACDEPNPNAPEFSRGLVPNYNSPYFTLDKPARESLSFTEDLASKQPKARLSPYAAVSPTKHSPGHHSDRKLKEATKSATLLSALQKPDLDLACTILDEGVDFWHANSKDRLAKILGIDALSNLLHEATYIGHPRLIQLLSDLKKNYTHSLLINETPLGATIPCNPKPFPATGAGSDCIGEEPKSLVDGAKKSEDSSMPDLLPIATYPRFTPNSLGNFGPAKGRVGNDGDIPMADYEEWGFNDSFESLVQPVFSEDFQVKSLILACNDGDFLGVRQILRTYAHRSGTSTFPYINIVKNDTTALIAAVRNGHLRIVKLLIQYGADVNLHVSTATPLSAAAERKLEPIMRVLLKHRADLLAAVGMLRQFNPENETAIKRLNQIAIQYWNEISRDLSKLRQFRQGPEAVWREFIKIHAGMLREIGPATQYANGPYAFDHNSRRGWKRGVNTLRGLCNKSIPQTLNETLMFLGVAKAMVAVMSIQGDGEMEREFNADLSRWQIIFKSRSRQLEAFRDIILKVWGVNLDDYPQAPAPDIHSLEQFQHLALSLVLRGGRVIHFKHTDYDRLLSVQTRWRERNHGIPDVHVSNAAHKIADGLSNMSTGLFDSPREDSMETSEDDGLRDLMRAGNTTSAHHECVLALLMAGAIFTVMISFLIIGLQNFYRPASEYLPAAYAKYICELRGPIILQAAQHIISIAQAKFTPDPLLWNLIYDRIEIFVRAGAISGFSKLMAYFWEEPLLQLSVKNEILLACTAWQSSYALQESYRKFEAYLGLKNRFQIVPLGDCPEYCLAELPSSQPTMGGPSAGNAAHDPKYTVAVSNPASSSLAGPVNTYGTPTALSPSSPLINFSMSNNSPAQTFTPATSAPSAPSAPITPHQNTNGQGDIICDICGRQFNKVFNLNKHRRDIHEKVRHHCSYPGCGKNFSRNDYRMKHEREKHGGAGR